MKAKHPIQPLEYDKHGTLRFKKNAIVTYLLDSGGSDMNKLAMMPYREQFAQLTKTGLNGPTSYCESQLCHYEFPCK